MESSTRSLDNVELLRALPAAERDRLARRVRWRRVAARELVLGHLDESTEVYFLIEGALRATVYSVSGREVAFRDLRPGQLFGELAALDGRPRSASIIALTESLVAALSAEDFRALIRQQPAVAETMLRELTALVRQLSERIFEFSTLAVRNRLHAELLRLAGSAGRGSEGALITPAPTHAELASRISTHREAITRELTALARAGLVEQRRGALLIKDVDELRRMVHEVTGLPPGQFIV